MIRTNDIVKIRPGWPGQEREGIVMSTFRARYHYALVYMLDSLTPMVRRHLGLERVRRASSEERKITQIGRG